VLRIINHQKSKIMKRQINYIFITLLIITISACTNPGREFNKAKEENTIEAYSRFLE